MTRAAVRTALLLAVAAQASAFVPGSVSVVPVHGMTPRRMSSSSSSTDDESPPPSPTPTGLPQQPRRPPQRRLDPLIASLTRTDPGTQNLPTTRVPFIGEIPADNTLAILAPAAVFAVLGLLLCVVTVFQQSDAIANALLQTGQDIGKKIAEQPNQVYPPDVCRGICSNQESNIDGLKQFMQSISPSR